MNPLGLIFGGGLQAVDGLVRSIFGSRAERDMYAAHENAAGMSQYAAEYQYRGERFWFDSLVDAVNRLMRPSMWFSTLGLFYVAAFDPTYFSIIAQALGLVPEALWVILGIMVGFLFPSRMIEKLPVMRAFSGLKGPTAAEIEQVREVQTEQNYEEALRDEGETMPNWAILEWNRRRGGDR